MKYVLTVLFLLAAAVYPDEMQDGHIAGERFFHTAGVAVRLVGEDSVLVTFGARSEDLQNTVGVFPYYDETYKHRDTANFRLFERKLEIYLQERLPVRVDGKNVYMRVVQWKPGGKGRNDGLDMASLFVDDLFITLGGRLPKKRTTLDVTANVWVERTDAVETVVQFSLFEGRTALRRLWTKREKTVRFPLAPDSLRAMRANPPPPVPVSAGDEDEEDHDDHTGHSH
jgi:hypothetical protein